MADGGPNSLNPPKEAGGAFSRDQLVSLASKITMLRQDGRSILGRIRGSLLELRAQRERLAQRVDRRTAPTQVPRVEESPAARLQREFGLTRREAEVALLLVQGKSNARIASALRISPHTARHHTQHILTKLGVHSRGEAAAKIRG